MCVPMGAHTIARVSENSMVFRYKQAKAIHFISLHYQFFNLIGKTNDVQTNTGHYNTEHVLTTNFAGIFL